MHCSCITPDTNVTKVEKARTALRQDSPAVTVASNVLNAHIRQPSLKGRSIQDNARRAKKGTVIYTVIYATSRPVLHVHCSASYARFGSC